MIKKRVFSGIQPTGQIHLGNYLGAVKNWVDSQDEYENIFCVVNSHAITTTQNPKELKENTYELTAMLLACGIDMKKSNLFIQSEIDEHPALSWIFDCNVSMGEMNRMTQFKDKSAKNPKNINVGLFNYPVLMAADILLYQADGVPVGEDQKQHLELTRNIAQRFNRDFGECFKIPEPMIPKTGSRVMGLDDPTTKMSKSSKGANHAIFLLDAPDVIMRKIKKATTDSQTSIVFDENREGLYNLLSIYEVLTHQTREAIEKEFEGKGYGEFKVAVAEVIIESLRPIREKYEQISNQKGYIEKILQEGADKVRPIASKTYQKAKELVGLV
ncbi:tryptophan--tRNA ligase [Helicobacter cappadocius]|uniref:Tryptophan--tRNA ligase n=1 Tax=Helicobacter cappadocius TaxID=3063998 RepID=A0AA90PT74_9HELI|nr:MULTISPECIES: tryptophan--tRNA ligase [unclassified Helicobacter]MDO7252956.1 tryptophan--tRNA ligase [Helicobacter sp. faydin-H75]MDP2539054.1 tryptophan--tRNA ligase [Helicobacter sp. faydin-H76]